MVLHCATRVRFDKENQQPGVESHIGLGHDHRQLSQRREIKHY